MVGQFVADFRKYFDKNGFDVELQNQFGSNGTITEVNATYKDLEFKLSSVNYDRGYMYIQGLKNINEEIQVTLADGFPNYFVWKENIEARGKRLIDMSGLANGIYKGSIERIVIEEELDKFIEEELDKLTEEELGKLMGQLAPMLITSKNPLTRLILSIFVFVGPVQIIHIKTLKN